MTRYWIKILLGAFLVFGLGLAVYSAGRSMVRHVDSDHDITIPLGAFIPFNVGGERLGTIRSLSIRRSAPKSVIGFAVRARVSDTVTLDRLRSCRMSVTDLERIDEHTTFVCLQADSGFEEFGEVRLEARLEGATRTVIVPLLLPSGTVQEIRGPRADSTMAVDSLAAGIRERARAQSRSYQDSVRAAELEERARLMQQQAESIRARRNPPPPPP